MAAMKGASDAAATGTFLCIGTITTQLLWAAFVQSFDAGAGRGGFNREGFVGCGEISEAADPSASDAPDLIYVAFFGFLLGGRVLDFPTSPSFVPTRWSH